MLRPLLCLFFLLTGISRSEDARPEPAGASEVEIPGAREGGVRIGKDSAPVLVLVFTDYTCPHCATLHAETLEALRKAWVDPGKVVLEIRHLPRLDDKSLGLVRAALAAEKAARAKPIAEGVDWRVWEFQKALFEFAGVLPEKGYPALAGEKGIDEVAFREAWDAIEVREELLADADLADAVGLKSLPTLVVAPRRAGKKSSGVLLEGEVKAAVLLREIEKAAKP